MKVLESLLLQPYFLLFSLSLICLPFTFVSLSLFSFSSIFFFVLIQGKKCCKVWYVWIISPFFFSSLIPPLQFLSSPLVRLPLPSILPLCIVLKEKNSLAKFALKKIEFIFPFLVLPHSSSPFSFASLISLSFSCDFLSLYCFKGEEDWPCETYRGDILRLFLSLSFLLPYLHFPLSLFSFPFLPSLYLYCFRGEKYLWEILIELNLAYFSFSFIPSFLSFHYNSPSLIFFHFPSILSLGIVSKVERNSGLAKFELKEIFSLFFLVSSFTPSSAL